MGKRLGKGTRWNEVGISGNLGCVTALSERKSVSALDPAIDYSYREMYLTGRAGI